VSVVIFSDGEEQTLPASSLFIFIGAEPHTSWLQGVVKGDEKGFVLTGPDLMRDGQPPKDWPFDREPYFLETSVPGIFAAGDVRHGSIKRCASSAGEGQWPFSLSIDTWGSLPSRATARVAPMVLDCWKLIDYPASTAISISVIGVSCPHSGA
jgi:hypothetical protein